MRIRFGLFLALSTALISTSSFADDVEASPKFSEENLTGDWGGSRTNLFNRGISLEAVYKLDLWDNLSGGVKQGSNGLDNLDVKLAVDGEKLYGLKGNSILIYFLNNNGSHPNASRVGSNAGIDNIEVGQDTAKLYQAFIQQNFMDDRLSFLAGLFDLNSEFYVTDTSGLFINPTYGIGTEMAATGENGPSIFPVTSLAFRASVKPTESTYIQAAVFDGVPGDPHNAKGTHIQFDGDGALVVAEAGCNSETTGHYGVGIWHYTKESDDFVRVDASGNPLKKSNNGIYFLAEKSLWKDKSDSKKDLSGFARVGFANGDVSQFDYSWATGLVYTGIIPTRDDAQLGIAVSSAHNASKFRDSVIATGGSVEENETQVELTYRDNITPWLAIQPDLQYTINPGTDPALSNAWTVGARFEINF